MIISLRKWIERGKFLLLFVLLTFVLYQLYSMLTLWIEPSQRYKEPMGSSAVKVFQHRDYNADNMSMPDRLRLFFWYGE